jgi:hypothetical protein
VRSHKEEGGGGWKEEEKMYVISQKPSLFNESVAVEGLERPPAAADSFCYHRFKSRNWQTFSLYFTRIWRVSLNVIWFEYAVLGSLILPLHRCIGFYYIYFPSVSNYDLNSAVSVRFIDSTTLPLHGDPIHQIPKMKMKTLRIRNRIRNRILTLKP